MIQDMISGGLAALIGALIGSIPFGLLVTRAAGLGDIRNIGSGSIGATNVLRTGKKGLALATVLLDALKGTLAVFVVHWFIGAPWDVVAGVAAVIGHCHPPWLGGRGGKGVATAYGVLLPLAWPVFILTALAWLAAAAISRISSVGALAAMTMAIVSSLVLAPGAVGVGISAMAAFIIWRHRPNIERLLAGKEPRIGEGK